MDHQGVPATELTDEELTHQGTHAHVTRNWVFLHGTAAQFRHHTERMLELEQEYLRRYPKRTWQGSGGGDAIDLAEVDALEQVRRLTRAYASAVDALLSRRDGAKPADGATPMDGAGSAAAGASAAEVELLRRYAAAPGGRLHKLEAHQAARAMGLSPAAVADLYKADPALLVTAGEYRQITEAGRARAGA